MVTTSRIALVSSLLALACALGSGGCRSTAPQVGAALPAPEALESISEANQNGEFVRALGEADALIAASDLRSPAGARTGFTAALLAAQAQLSCANSAAFLRERDSDGVWQLSSVAHSVAAMRYFALARSLAPRAARASLEGRPADEVANGLRDANLVELALHARLGLRASVNSFLRRSPQLHDAKACVELAMQAPLAGRRPWLYAALFEFLRQEDERQAFRFAVLAIDEAPAAGPDFGAARVAELERWILSESSLEYHCPRCDLGVNPGLRACPNDRTPNFDFVGRKRL